MSARETANEKSPRLSEAPPELKGGTHIEDSRKDKESPISPDIPALSENNSLGTDGVHAEGESDTIKISYVEEEINGESAEIKSSVKEHVNYNVESDAEPGTEDKHTTKNGLSDKDRDSPRDHLPELKTNQHLFVKEPQSLNDVEPNRGETSSLIFNRELSNKEEKQGPESLVESDNDLIDFTGLRLELKARQKHPSTDESDITNITNITSSYITSEESEDIIKLPEEETLNLISTKTEDCNKQKHHTLPDILVEHFTRMKQYSNKTEEQQGENKYLHTQGSPEDKLKQTSSNHKLDVDISPSSLSEGGTLASSSKVGIQKPQQPCNSKLSSSDDSTKDTRIDEEDVECLLWCSHIFRKLNPGSFVRRRPTSYPDSTSHSETLSADLQQEQLKTENLFHDFEPVTSEAIPLTAEMGTMTVVAPQYLQKETEKGKDVQGKPKHTQGESKETTIQEGGGANEKRLPLVPLEKKEIINIGRFWDKLAIVGNVFNGITRVTINGNTGQTKTPIEEIQIDQVPASAVVETSEFTPYPKTDTPCPNTYKFERSGSFDRFHKENKVALPDCNIGSLSIPSISSRSETISAHDHNIETPSTNTDIFERKETPAQPHIERESKFSLPGSNIGDLTTKKDPVITLDDEQPVGSVDIQKTDSKKSLKKKGFIKKRFKGFVKLVSRVKKRSRGRKLSKEGTMSTETM